MTATPFHVLAKPIGPICNLDCHYCYYLHTEDLYGRGNRWQMTDSRLEQFVRQYIESQPLHARDVEFVWQGGEPTLLGLDFFRKAVSLQKKHVRPGMTVRNCLQTNGVLLDESWCAFLRENGFLVGLSIDGPAHLHDSYRVDRQGKSTHAAVVRALQLLQAQRVEFNTMVCVHRANGDHGAEVYSYLRDIGCRYMQFIPIVERRGAGRHAEATGSDAQPEVFTMNTAEEAVSSRSVLPGQFGRFLISVFDEWIRQDVGKVFVQIFDESLAMWTGMESSLCIFRRECGESLVIEHNGDVYSCDHFVKPSYLLGNIERNDLNSLVDLPAQVEFGRSKATSLPQYCHVCEVRFACNGECPKNRILLTPDGEPGLNYLCEGYRSFFNHIDSPLRKMASALQASMVDG
ncbi:MAG: anaerobic sulfatase maturase [Fuerstia sp.]|nr:anaerobic sulfatase maturase [Fuerstiella sp.]